MIRLRELRQSDMSVLHKWINDPEIIQFTNAFRPISDMEQQEWSKNIGYFKNNYVFGIERQDENKLIGTCGLYDIDIVSRKAELRMKICDSNERGKGYGREALDLLLKFGFFDSNQRKIWLRVLYSNAAAIKLYEKAGFVREGVLREDMYIRGNYEDVVIMSLMISEYYSFYK